MQLIPVRADVPSLTVTQTLDGADYVFKFRWNSRGGWFLEVADAGGTTIMGARRLTVNTDWLANARHDERCPRGVLTAIDLTGADRDPGYADLVSGPDLTDPKGRVAVLYVPEEEL